MASTQVQNPLEKLGSDIRDAIIYFLQTVQASYAPKESSGEVTIQPYYENGEKHGSNSGNTSEEKHNLLDKLSASYQPSFAPPSKGPEPRPMNPSTNTVNPPSEPSPSQPTSTAQVRTA